jgi:hypothetical protein
MEAASHVSAGGDVIDPNADEIAAAQLAVDGEVEHRQIAFAVLDLKSDAMAQTSFGWRGRFWPTRRSLFHATREGALFVLISVDMVELHARPPPPQRPRSAGRPFYRNRTQLWGPCPTEEPVSHGKPSMALR